MSLFVVNAFSGKFIHTCCVLWWFIFCWESAFFVRLSHGQLFIWRHLNKTFHFKFYKRIHLLIRFIRFEWVSCCCWLDYSWLVEINLNIMTLLTYLCIERMYTWSVAFFLVSSYNRCKLAIFLKNYTFRIQNNLFWNMFQLAVTIHKSFLF